ncbi:hypothetical protein FKB36_08210 [Methanoculleus sp. Afa-1]|uniref:Uncharacterized protein n=1 Tax=Methanoculleus formosensis TaxID=2590886 RepID=A0A9E5DFB4_9EURY|nr:hypothetical protein [Methanoculleus sp. Afa-1]MCT8337470.1 hypothetical protein [Methanoculleus sp. Afa-1]
MMQKLLSGTLDHQEFLRVKNRNDGNPEENAPGSPPANIPDRHEFEQVEVEPGRCDIRDHGKAVYRSRETAREDL